MQRRSRLTVAAVMSVLILAGSVSGAIIGSNKEGLVEYVGAQKDIFVTGKAASVVSLEEFSGRPGVYAMGPVDGLDGEITIFDSNPSVTQVRGSDYVLDHSWNHGAFFLVWTERTQWLDVPVPASVKGYIDLQNFVKAQAQAAGIDVNKPFPFLLSGTPIEIKFHINVDRTGGRPITDELFVKSKAPFVTKNEPVDIVGFYTEHHAGIFTSNYTPAIKVGSGITNAIHIHHISRISKSSGHIDDITLGEGMVLRLPKP